ncbi:MAG: hypothetical protein JXN61_08080 [Sedimentisphaerales bacterium]|nr:hypothetical protein [Sedimentisphaerales bacterium]
MAEYSVEVCRELEGKFAAAGLHRPMRITRYEPGTELAYEVTSVAEGIKAAVTLKVERFVGGGFAGQVYQVRIQDIQAENSAEGKIEGLEVGGLYAMKILIPPSRFSCLFRNVLYWIGFQGPFQLQVNPAAARAGAIWQKFIRRAAQTRFGDEKAVVDIYATFVDPNLGSCGELSEWVDGRTWRLEVDDRMDLLKQSRRGKVDDSELGLPEYRAKRKFMREFVELLHDVGAYEFARQYEWSTCKSQPNCLKRRDSGSDPAAGLTAVDFRAGLALLPFLPMSPGDFKLIIKGLMRGSLVQFDRGNIKKLEGFIAEHRETFTDTGRMLDELKEAEEIYRNSTPDIAHNHVRLLYSPKLWSTIFDRAVTGWAVQNKSDDVATERLRRSRIHTLLFGVLGMLPGIGLLLTILGVLTGIGVGLAALFGCRASSLGWFAAASGGAFAGGIVLSAGSKLILKVWGRADYRRHYKAVLTSWDYFKRALRAKIAERTIEWHRKGRISGERARKFAEQPWRYFAHLPFLLLVFPSLHRLVTDGKFAKEKLRYIFIRPFKLYFSSPLREQWLRDMVLEGKKKHIITDEDAETILSRVKEPYIQRYLISLVAHLFTLPLTQIVSVIVAAIYYRRTGDKVGAGGILVLFQVIPISPGSIARGLYAVGIAVYDRSFKNYNIAVFLSFFKYIGYLAFPIQMTYHYPVLARFMAAHWATDAVHIVPVFGERGALLEHWVYCLFYNWPLTIRRRMGKRAEIRAKMKPRYWHVGLYTGAVAGCMAMVDLFYIRHANALPSLKEIWWLLAALPLLNGAVVTLGCGGAPVWKRIVGAVVGGIAAVTACTIIVAVVRADEGGITAGMFAKTWVWRSFIFAVVSAIGAIITELRLGEPRAE